MESSVPEGFYPVATELDLLVASVLGSVPDWVTPCNEARNDFEDHSMEESLREAAETQEREFVLNLKSMFGGGPRVPVILDLLESLQILKPKTKTSTPPHERKKRKKRLAAEKSVGEEFRPKRPKRDGVDSAGKAQGKLDSAVNEQDSVEVKVEEGEGPMEGVQEDKSTPERLSPDLKSFPQQSVVSFENHLSLVTSQSVFVSEAFLTGCLDLTDVRKYLIGCFPYTGKRELVAGVEHEDCVGIALRSLPNLVRNKKLFHLASNGASPMDIAWANKLSSTWALCDEELLKAECQLQDCPFQHKKQYMFAGKELVEYRFSIGDIDRAALAGVDKMSLLTWTLNPPKDLLPRQVVDDIPLYSRSVRAEGQAAGTRSSLLRLVKFNLKELSLRSVQPQLGFYGSDPLNLSFWPQAVSVDGALRSMNGKKDEENVEDVLVNGLKMIDFGTGERTMKISCRQQAMKYFASRLTTYSDSPLLWKVYLSLLLRDPGEAFQTKHEQSQRFWTKYRPWYRGIVMLAATKPTIKDKLEIYQEGISDLLSSNEVTTLSAKTTLCVMDLALRLIYLESTKDLSVLLKRESACSSLLYFNEKQSLSSGKDSLEGKPGWIQKLFSNLSHSPEQRFLFGIALLYCYLYGRLPSELMNSFGFPKIFKVFQWDILDVGITNIQKIESFLFFLVSNEASGDGFFTMSAPLNVKQIFLTNILLMCKASSIKKPLALFKAIFLEASTELGSINADSTFLLLEIARTLDRKLECGDLLTQCGGGFLQEQMINSMMHSGEANLVIEWSQQEKLINTELEFRPKLALVKLYLQLGSNLPARSLLDTFKSSMECFHTTEQTEEVFHTLAMVYACILNNENDKVQQLIRAALSLPRVKKHLRERVWSELLILMTAALPSEDPRKPEDPSSVGTFCHRQIPLPVIKGYFKERETCFQSLICMIKDAVTEIVQTKLALDNHEEIEIMNPRVRAVLDPPRMPEISPLLETLLLMIPQLLQSEILRLLEILVEWYGTSPSLAEFLLQLRCYLPDNQRSLLRLLIQVLVHSNPCASFEIWKQVVDLAAEHGICLGEEIKAYINRFYPDWLQPVSCHPR